MTLDVKQARVVFDWAHTRPLTCCRFDPLGRYVFCGAEDAEVQRFALADGVKTSFAGGHASWVMALACTRDGQYVVSGGADGQLSWWEAAAEQPQPVRTIAAHSGWVRTMDASPDSQLIASAGNDTVVRLWNAADGSPVRELAGHERHVYCLRFHPSGQFLLTGDLMGKLKQWEVATGALVREFDASALHEYNGGQQVDFGGIRGIDVSPDGQFVAAGGLHKASNPLGAVHEPLVRRFRWDAPETAISQIAEGVTQGVIWRLCYLADGTLMGASGGGSGGLLVFWNAEQEKDVYRFALPSLMRDMDLSADGNRGGIL